jgi:DNA-binding transcriptional ArsR family regulator
MASVKQPGALNSTLGAIVAHPLRTRCLTVLSDRTASPSEIAQELREDVGNVSYHVKQLLKMEAIELVSERPVRGAVEHFYRAIRRPVLSYEENRDLSVEDRVRFARLVLQFSVADAATAIDSGSLGQRPDHHLTRLPIQVDEEGWKELSELQAESFERAMEIEAASAERLSADPESAGIPARVISMFFEMPPAERRH